MPQQISLKQLRLQKLGMRCLLVLGFWTLLGLSFACQNYFASIASENPIAWRRALKSALSDWYLMGALFYPTLWVSRRFQVTRLTQWRRIMALLVCGAIFSVVHLVLYVLVRAVVYPEDKFAFLESFGFWFVRRFHGNVFYYLTFVVVGHALDYYRQLRERELRAAELEGRLSQAQLQALKMQLQPHFLFNTLNTISEMIHEDPAAADRMITALSDLLRSTLDNTGRQHVLLRQELEFLSRYLQIEQGRLGERLAVDLDISPETLDASVPNLILQPIVENAIRHGIAPYAKAGRVTIESRRRDGVLELRVRDTGPGLADLSLREIGKGIGLANTEARLQRLYGPRFVFELSTGKAGGVSVLLAIPFQIDGQTQDAAAYEPGADPRGRR